MLRKRVALPCPPIVFIHSDGEGDPWESLATELGITFVSGDQLDAFISVDQIEALTKSAWDNDVAGDWETYDVSFFTGQHPDIPSPDSPLALSTTSSEFSMASDSSNATSPTLVSAGHTAPPTPMRTPGTTPSSSRESQRNTRRPSTIIHSPSFCFQTTPTFYPVPLIPIGNTMIGTPIPLTWSVSPTPYVYYPTVFRYTVVYVNGNSCI